MQLLAKPPCTGNSGGCRCDRRFVEAAKRWADIGALPGRATCAHGGINRCSAS